MKKTLIQRWIMPLFLGLSFLSQAQAQDDCISQYDAGVSFLLKKDFEQALVCLEEARKGFKEKGMTEYELSAIMRIAETRTYLDDFSGALAAYNDASHLASSKADDAKKMSIFGAMRDLCEKMGDTQQMVDLSFRMDSLSVVSCDTTLLFTYNQDKGKAAKNRGAYKEAERWYLKNEPYVKSEGDNPYRWPHYYALYGFYYSSGQWDRSLHYAELAHEESREEYEKSDPFYYIPYRDIAIVYSKKGDRSHCLQYLDSLFMAEPLLNNVYKAQLLYFTRAVCYSHFGDFGQALIAYQKADSLLATKYDEEDVRRVQLLPIIAGLEYRNGHLDISERLYRRNAQVVRRLYGDDSQSYVEALVHLANAEGVNGHFDEACDTYQDAIGRLRSQIRLRVPYCNTSEREGYWGMVSSLVRNMTPFAIKAEENQSAFTRACYDGLILSKAFLLSSDQTMYDLIKRRGTAKDLMDYSKIQAMHAKITEGERRGSPADSILSYTTKVNQLEWSLTQRCRAYGDAMSFMDVDYEQIKQSLGPDDILLDFTDFESASRGRVYAVYAVNREQSFPLLKELFQERNLDSLGVSSPYQYYSGKPAESIYHLLWEPIKDLIPEGARVYYVPTQLLFQIAPESIPVGDGSLLGDHYHFVRLSSAKELVRYDPSIKAKGEAIVYGGLHYSTEADIMVREAKKYRVPSLFTFRSADPLDKGVLPFEDLPGSRIEVDAICSVLRSAGWTVHPFTGNMGTEESFLSISGRAPEILHLATHGFYYTPDRAQKVEFLRGYSDAMNLSGVVLAGGNASWMGQGMPEGVFGGILTAADIARMDLSGVELAVLSACHSGTGEATPEGLFGLQRALKKAGVKTLILSLWAESDVVGPAFMSAFYKNLVGDCQWDKQKAFDLAKNEIRERYPDSPSYWAGFVLLD